MAGEAQKNNAEIVLLTKTGGPLTKKIQLGDDGEVHSDGSACIMARGSARRVSIADVDDLGALIGSMRPDQAIALGAMRPGLPYEVEVVTKREINGATRPDVISRSADNIVFDAGRPGFLLLDFDTKGMPSQVAERIRQEGGFWSALVSVIPELEGVARVTRASTSAGLFNRTTGTPVPGSNGEHVYLQVWDVADSGRFLRTLHARCWLAGLGWFMVGAAGQMLERSIVDRMVGAPERLAFEGAPVLVEPLAQDAEARRPRVVEGRSLDTLAACPPLTVLEKNRLDELREKAKHELGGKSAEVRDKFIGRHAADLAKRTGMTMPAAMRTIRRQCDGVLLPHIPLAFDDPALAGKTVADVLGNPAAFEGETLADPQEGVEYGRCKAKIMRRADGTLFIHSFAHGRIIYELKLDAAAIRDALSAAGKEDVVTVLVDLLLRADVDEAEEHSIITDAKERTGIGMRVIERQLKAARHAQAEEAKKEDRARRTDPRPVFKVPAPDVEILPVIGVFNEVIARSADRIPPGRDINGNLVSVWEMAVEGTHAFTGEDEHGNFDNTKEASPQPIINVMTIMEAAEMIERHINYVDKAGRSVHCPTSFVGHYLLRRDDIALPRIRAVATLPMVSADGRLIYADGLDRERGIVFNIPPGLMDIMPRREDCDKAAVGEAMQFLLDDWLADVATDHTGKCSLVVLALVMIERSLLDQRPVFFVTAGLSGSGKTTAIHMIIEAVTGRPAAASAFSFDQEERRKALLSYFIQGVPYILWDNIPRGAQIWCPCIEMACSNETFVGRPLGVTGLVSAPATGVQIFTGNNIGPKGDLISRSLQVRLEADQANPQDRDFVHPNVIEWTRNNRSRIIRALFTVLLGNSMLDARRDAHMKTRFDMAYRIVGSAVEHASRCMGRTVDFGALFYDQDDDESVADLTGMLPALGRLMANAATAPWFKAVDLSRIMDFNDFNPEADANVVGRFLGWGRSSHEPMTAAVAGKRLKEQVGNLVKIGGREFTLRARKRDNSWEFRVEDRAERINW